MSWFFLQTKCKVQSFTSHLPHHNSAPSSSPTFPLPILTTLPNTFTPFPIELPTWALCQSTSFSKSWNCNSSINVESICIKNSESSNDTSRILNMAHKIVGEIRYTGKAYWNTLADLETKLANVLQAMKLSPMEFSSLPVKNPLHL